MEAARFALRQIPSRISPFYLFTKFTLLIYNSGWLGRTFIFLIPKCSASPHLDMPGVALKSR
jgi:hypothetical protein